MDSRVKPENYITIMGWMITNLRLSGNELMVFAIIYGFSQDGESKFTGNLKYLEDFSTASKSTVKRSLESLVSKGVLIKETKLINHITFNSYSTPDGISKWTPPVQNEPGQNKDTEVMVNRGRGHGEPGGEVMVNPNILLDNTIDNKNTNTGGVNGLGCDGLLFPLETAEEKEKKVAPKKEKIPFDTFWDEYDKKADRPKCERKWENLCLEDQQAIMIHIPLYKEATPDRAYRKDPSTFLNNRSWENEIIKKQIVNGTNQQQSGKGNFNGSKAERTTAGQYALGAKLHQLLTGQPG